MKDDRSATPRDSEIAVQKDRTGEIDARESRDAPIFIGGAGRSGTSLVRSIVNAHPRIAIGPELKITPYIAQCWAKVRTQQAYLTSTYGADVTLVDRSFRELLMEYLDVTLRHSNAERVGEKSPNNVLFFRHLHVIFPESPLIHVMRDGRDVVRSLLSQDWSSEITGESIDYTQDARSAAEYWKSAICHGLDAAERLADTGLFLTVKYEELVRRPEKEVRRICAFLGEDWSDRMLRFYEHDDPYYEEVHRPISDASVGRWKDELSRDQKDQVKDVAGDLLVGLEYAEDRSW